MKFIAHRQPHLGSRNVSRRIAATILMSTFGLSIESAHAGRSPTNAKLGQTGRGTSTGEVCGNLGARQSDSTLEAIAPGARVHSLSPRKCTVCNKRLARGG
jgi:hypothetical protein